MKSIIGRTVRELVAECNRDADYEEWLARLRRENAESERQREQVRIENERERIGATRFGSEPTDLPDGTFDEEVEE